MVTRDICDVAIVYSKMEAHDLQSVGGEGTDLLPTATSTPPNVPDPV
jgi:hypothetical protein